MYDRSKITAQALPPRPWRWIRPHPTADYHDLVDANGNKIMDDGSSGGEYTRDIAPEGALGRGIRAIPDMLAALEAVERARNIKDAGEADDAMSDADVLIQDAIAKATGGDS